MAARRLTNRAILSLATEFKSLSAEPVEGFRVKLCNDNNLFVWEVAIFGPPDTLYMGGYYRAIMKFPQDYPYNPPSLRFLTNLWHPNVYENGNVCISILHAPGEDPYSDELPNERWNPTQCVRTILLSVISLLSEPNVLSPANVNASVMYRRWLESDGSDSEYGDFVRQQAKEARMQAELDGIVVPMTVEEYCAKRKPQPKSPRIGKLSFYYESDSSDEEEDDEEADNPDYTTDSVADDTELSQDSDENQADIVNTKLQ